MTTFLLRDDFITSAAAPLASPRTAEPGPGTLTITDTGNSVSIAAGKLTISTASAGANDPRGVGVVFGRVSGRALVAKLKATVNVVEVGWNNTAGAGSLETLRAGATNFAIRANGTGIDVGTLGTVNEYMIAAVLRAAGCLLLVKGGTFTNWTLLWPASENVNSNNYPAYMVNTLTAAGTIDNFRVTDLPAPFNPDFGLATQRLSGARVNGDTFVHEANCVIEWVITTLPTGAEDTVSFRRQDANNGWHVQVTTVGTINLFEQVAGGFTSRGSVATIVSSGHRMVAVADGSTIRVYSNNVLRITYASATNFSSEVAGRVAISTGGAVSDIVSWPRTITGVPASILDAAVDGSGDLTATLGSVTLSSVGLNQQPTFLLRDDFITSAAAPLTSPHTAEPGPGTLIIADTGQVVSISSGMLQIGAVRAGVGDPALWGAGFARASGLAVVSVVSSAATNVVIGIGFDVNQSGAISIGTYLAGGTEVRALSVAGQISSTNIYAAGIKKTAVVARSVGELCFFHNGTNWILIWVDAVDTNTPLYPAMTSFGGGTVAALAIDTFRALQLPAPFNTDFGLATQRLAGARLAGDTFVHTADCVLEWAQTTLNAGGTTLVFFHKQDSTNYWQIMITAVGDFRLYEIVAGTPTQRATAAAVIVSGHRIVIVADGTTIRGYSNNILRWTYATATNFQTATAGELNSLGTGGAISDIVIWPRILSGQASVLLDAAVGGRGDLTTTLADATLTAVGLSWQPTFLLRDEFTTPASAPLTSLRTAEPGPGMLVITDGNNKLSIVNGRAVFATGGINNGDPGLWDSVSIARAAGIAVVVEVTHTSGTLYVGVDANQTSVPTEAIVFATTTQLQVFTGGGGFDVGAIVAGSSYQVATVLRGTGCFFFIKGGVFANWTLLYVSVVGTDARFPAITAGGTTAVSSSSLLRALQLPAPYATDYGLATQRLAGAQVAGTTFVHEANCVLEWAITTLSTTLAMTVRFRKQDSNNYWAVQVNTTGSLSLNEVVAGGSTGRGSVAGGTVTAGHRIVVVCDSSTIRVYSNNVLRVTYASAANFATSTAGEINSIGDGVISDIVTWPRTLSAVSAAILDAATIPYTAAQSTATLADATLAAAGKLAIGGQIASTLADATLAAVGLHGITAQLAVTLADVTEVSSAKVKISGQITVSLASAILAASGRLSIKAQLNVPLNSVKLEAYNHPIEIISGTIYGQANTGFVFGQQIQGEVMGI